MAAPNPILPGTSFYYLTVLEYVNKHKGYLCLCVCGKKITSRSHALRTGRTKSCGCYIKAFMTNRVKPNHEAAKNYIYKNYRQAAKRKNIQFTLTKEELVSFITKRCEYCGRPPQLILSSRRKNNYDPVPFKYNGIDRVDNDRGYVLENCTTACFICNRGKYTMTREAFMLWIKDLINFRKDIL